MRTTKCFALLGGLAIGVGIGLAPLAAAATGQPRALPQQFIGKPLAGPRPAVLDRTRDVEVFVRLKTASVAEYNASELARGRNADRGAQIQQARKVSNEQAAFRKHLTRLGARELTALRVGVNGFRVKVNPGQIERLRALPGVRSVAPVTLHKPDLVYSVPWIGSPAVWSSLGNGDGITVAVLDTGIDYTHANFGGSGDPNAYIQNNPNIIEFGTFPTAKVIGGYDLAGPNYDASTPGLDIPQPDADPLDGAAHGSHVGGIVAGLGVDGSIGPGVAPGALLYAVKVFGDTGGSTNLTADGIEWALDPNGDGSMDDHADVINMSLGAPFGSPEDPSALASDNAVENGIIVVASAGNEGDIPYVTGSPAVGKYVISVASSVAGGRVVLALKTLQDGVEELHHGEEGDGPVTIAEAPRSNTLVASESPTDDGLGNPIPGTSDNLGCFPFTNANLFRGKIAFVRRGICLFNTKYHNAMLAGAQAIVVYNDGIPDGSDPRIEPIIMGGLDGNVSIPGIMISSTDGYPIYDALTAGASITGSMAEDIVTPAPSALDDTISEFSSRGPGHGGSVFKPNITAPGDGIVSTDQGTGTGGVAFSGTSMAAPHVAGAAALLKQKHPDADPRWIRGLLMNSAQTAEIEGPGTGTPYPLARQGTGVVRVDQAAALNTATRPGGVTFGAINPFQSLTVTRPIAVWNMNDEAQHYTSTHVPNQTLAGVTVSCPAEFDIAAGAMFETSMSIHIDPAQGDADDGSFSQSELDGWCMVTNGVDTLRIGYIAAIDPASKIGAIANGNAVRITNRGPVMGWTEGFTLAGLGGENMDDTQNAIKAFGFRAGDPSQFEGANVVEFAVATERKWEIINDLAIDIYIDADEDGRDDVLLTAIDGSFGGGGLGQYITSQSPIDANGNPGPAIADWTVVKADYNDAGAVLPFSNQPGGIAFLPEGDNDFAYRMEITDLNNGSVDVQRGRIDMTRAIVAESESYGLAPGESITMNTEGVGQMLWLFQSNPWQMQSFVVNVQ
jgi:subtilisin family serine protease